MSSETEPILRRELAPGEQILWLGMPQQGLRLTRADVFIIPFSILWGGFAIVWECMALLHGPIFFALWGVPFVLIGLYLMVGRFFADSRNRARTFYGVTNERILIVRGRSTREVKSLPLRNLAELSLQERADMSGTILFGPVNPMYAMWMGTGWPGTSRHMPPAFETIPDVRKVYSLIQSEQQTQR